MVAGRLREQEARGESPEGWRTGPALGERGGRGTRRRVWGVLGLVAAIAVAVVAVRPSVIPGDPFGTAGGSGTAASPLPAETAAPTAPPSSTDPEHPTLDRPFAGSPALAWADGAAGIRWTRLDGSTRDRGAVVYEFQSESGPPVMLASLKAGGTGLNLTAADHVFLLDPWWNPAVEDQAADRAHRIGQDRPVMVYRLVAKDTVEEGILALQEKKRALSDVALGGADQAGGLTRDDLLALLQ